MLAGALELQMSANLARLADDMQKATRIVGGATRDIEGMVANAKSALGALGIGLGVGYFVSLIKGSIDAADHLENLSKSTHLTVTELAGLKLLAAETGSDVDGLAKGIDKMSVAIGKEPEKFRALGVTAKDNKEAFKQLADIFNLLPDIQQRNALAQAVFNKSWMEMAPALSLGGKAIGEVMDKGAQYSGVTEEMTKRAHEFKVQMAELETTLGATKIRLVGDMLPALIRVSEEMLRAAREGEGLLGVVKSLSRLSPATDLFKAERDIVQLTDELLSTQNEILRRRGVATNDELDALEGYARGVQQRLNELIKLRRVLAGETDMFGTPTAAGAPPGVDPAAAADAAARAKAFLGEQDLYAARVAAIKGFAATYSAEIKTQSTLADLAFKEGGINNQRTQEELILQQATLEDQKLRSQLESYQKLKALADQKGPTGAADAAKNVELIAQANAAIVANEVITQARIRAERTITAQQQMDQYNAWADGLAAQGAAIAASFGTEAEITNKAYADKLAALEVYLAANRDQITNDNELRERLELEHQAALGNASAQGALQRKQLEAMTLSQQAQFYFGYLAQVTAAGAQHNLALFRLNQAAGIANAIMSTSIGAAKALEWGFPLGPIFAAIITAAGLVEIETIRSARFGGGSSAPSIGGGTAIPVTPAIGAGASPSPQIANEPQSSQVVVQVIVQGNIVGNQQFVDEVLIPGIRDAVDNRDFTIIGSNSRQAAELTT